MSKYSFAIVNENEIVVKGLMLEWHKAENDDFTVENFKVFPANTHSYTEAQRHISTFIHKNAKNYPFCDFLPNKWQPEKKNGKKLTFSWK